MNEKNKYKPNKKQTLFIDLYIDLNNRLTLTQICEEIGITRQTAWRWMQDQNFTDFLNSKRNEILTRSQTARILVAVEKALSGDFSFSKLLFELEGVYTQTLKSRADIKIEHTGEAKREDLEKELREELDIISERMEKAEKLKKEKLKKQKRSK
ncbi:unnamed protein product [marine sediment metagenome]|uniref:Homeodomain phBC6A51-type domain-containing protein n=1 Tax=marine sediment metagenome TaxID=412755 RepID=X1IIQ8_9ZZZZ